MIVKAARGDRVDIGVSGTTIDGSALHASRSVLQSDGLDAVHAMPRVVAVDDFRGDFSVRGSPYRQIGVVIDGVATPWLQHTVYGRNDAGSLSMFGSDILDRATLVAGAYPATVRRHARRPARVDPEGRLARVDAFRRDGGRA